MKTKLLSFAFVMLTVCGMQSQDTIANPPHPAPRTPHPASRTPHPELDTRPITFPFWMVKFIALDLEEKQRLELESELFDLELQTCRSLVITLEEKEQKRQLQLQLLQKNLYLLESQLKAAQQSNKGTGTFIWSLRLLAALGAGFVLGRL